MRVVLDTNVLISGLVYPNGIPGKIVGVWRRGGLGVVLSRHILAETERVLPTLKRARMRPDEVRDLIDALSLLADLVEPAPVREQKLRDIADLPVLGTLLASGCEYLISGDKDLLALAGRYPVVTPAQFWERHG